MDETQELTMADIEESTSQDTDTTPQNDQTNETVDDTTPQEVGDVETVEDETSADAKNDKEEEPVTLEVLDKRYKDLQADHTKTKQENAEFRRQQEELARQPQIVNEQGQVRPEIIQQEGFKLALREAAKYKQGARQFDTTTAEGQEQQTRVLQNLDLFEQTGNVNYLDEAKREFDPIFVQKITEAKFAEAQEIEKQLLQSQSQALEVMTTKFYKEVDEKAPLAKAFSDEKSEFYCPALAQEIKNIVGYNSVENVEKTLQQVVDSVSKYTMAQAKAKAQQQKEAKRQGAPSSANPQGTNPNKLGNLSSLDEKDLESAVLQYI